MRCMPYVRPFHFLTHDADARVHRSSDWYDPRRVHEMPLALTAEAASSGARAIVLASWMVLDFVARTAFISGQPSADGVSAGKEGSILAERSLLLQVPYPSDRKRLTANPRVVDGQGRSRTFGEDTVVVSQLRGRSAKRDMCWAWALGDRRCASRVRERADRERQRQSGDNPLRRN